MATRCAVCGDMDYSDMGDMPCSCALDPIGRFAPAPTEKDYCAQGGHGYYGDEYDPETAAPPEQRAEAAAVAGRCYCGEVRYPFGGPADTEESQP